MRTRVPCAYASMCSFVCSDFDQWQRSRSAASERDNAQFVSVKCNQNKLVSCILRHRLHTHLAGDLLFFKPVGPSRLPESWINVQSSRKKNKKVLSQRLCLSESCATQLLESISTGSAPTKQASMQASNPALLLLFFDQASRIAIYNSSCSVQSGNTRHCTFNY